MYEVPTKRRNTDIATLRQRTIIGLAAGRKSKAPAARDSPGGHSAQAASAAAGTDAVDRSSGREEAAKPRSAARV